MQTTAASSGVTSDNRGNTPAIESPSAVPATPNHHGVQRRPRDNRGNAPAIDTESSGVPGDNRGNAPAIESPCARWTPRRQSRQRASYRVPRCRACHAKPPRRPASPETIVATRRLVLESPSAVPATPNSRGVQRRPRRQSRQRASYRVPRCRACHAKPPRRPASPETIVATRRLVLESPSAVPATPNSRGVQRRPRRQSRQRASYRVPRCRACHAKPPWRPASPETIVATHGNAPIIESPKCRACHAKQPWRPASPATIAATG